MCSNIRMLARLNLGSTLVVHEYHVYLRNCPSSMYVTCLHTKKLGKPRKITCIVMGYILNNVGGKTLHVSPMLHACGRSRVASGVACCFK